MCGAPGLFWVLVEMLSSSVHNVAPTLGILIFSTGLLPAQYLDEQCKLSAG